MYAVYAVRQVSFLKQGKIACLHLGQFFLPPFGFFFVIILTLFFYISLLSTYLFISIFLFLFNCHIILFFILIFYIFYYIFSFSCYSNALLLFFFLLSPVLSLLFPTTLFVILFILCILQSYVTFLDLRLHLAQRMQVS